VGLRNSLVDAPTTAVANENASRANDADLSHAHWPLIRYSRNSRSKLRSRRKGGVSKATVDGTTVKLSPKEESIHSEKRSQERIIMQGVNYLSSTPCLSRKGKGCMTVVDRQAPAPAQRGEEFPPPPEEPFNLLLPLLCTQGLLPAVPTSRRLHDLPLEMEFQRDCNRLL